MPADLFANNASTTLAAGITSGATSLTVASSTGFPVPTSGSSMFRVLIGAEILTVTAVAGTTWTVTRGEESTAGAAHSSGDAVTLAVTAGALGNLGAGGGDYFRSGYYYFGHSGAALGTGNLTLSRLFVRPFLVPARRTFDRIGLSISTPSATGSGGLLRLGIYDNAQGLPGALVVDAGTISTESAGSKELTISETLSPGIWWLACVSQVVACSGSTLGTSITPWASNETTIPPTSPTSQLARNSVTGALPSTFGTTVSIGSTAPFAIALRAA